MQYKREEVRDMNLYGEILKKLEGTPCLALERSFVGEEGNLADMRCELREGAEASEIGKEALTQGQPVCGRAGSSWNVAEPFFPKERLIILGGGHVALPVAEFGARVGFLVTVVDDRLSFANPGRFPMAEKVICDDFGHAIKELKIQESDYICIVTRGHRHDADCLRMIGKGKEPAYLGMIGSRRRVGIVKQELLEEGYDPERMSRLKSPIGLKIGGVTPEEIAISILAEIIQVKRMDREDKRVKNRSDLDFDVLKRLAEEPDEPKAVVTVIESKGSSPRGAGAKMIVQIRFKYDEYTWTVTYMHLSRINCSSGDLVKIGDVIGLSGQTGRVTGPHLHIEILCNGNYKNPAGLISGHTKEQ